MQGSFLSIVKRHYEKLLNVNAVHNLNGVLFYFVLIPSECLTYVHVCTVSVCEADEGT